MNAKKSQKKKEKKKEKNYSGQGGGGMTHTGRAKTTDYVITHTEVETYHIRSPSGFTVTVRNGYFPSADFPSGRFKTWNCSCRQSVTGHSCRHFKMVADWIEANGRTQI